MDCDRWFDVVVAVFGTGRVTRLLAEEDGPGVVIAASRVWLGEGFPRRLMNCYYCVSLWIAAPIALLLTHRWIERVILWLTLSAAASLLQRLANPPTAVQRLSMEADEQ